METLKKNTLYYRQIKIVSEVFLHSWDAQASIILLLCLLHVFPLLVKKQLKNTTQSSPLRLWMAGYVGGDGQVLPLLSPPVGL